MFDAYILSDAIEGEARDLGDSVITGPTLTNVNDSRAIFIAAQQGDLSGSR
jgi:glycerate-2-kinase